MITFTLTKEQMIAALEANGWYTWYDDNNWVRKDAIRPDYAGCSVEIAFSILLRDKNIL